jgi:hypothetical protein
MSSSFLSPTFVIGSIRIGIVENASCINMGNNWPTGFENHQKLTQGFGSVHGDGNRFDGTKSLLNDADMLDMLNISDQDIPDWLQKWISSSGAAAADVPDPETAGGKVQDSPAP